jgi:hypothetical protein
MRVDFLPELWHNAAYITQISTAVMETSTSKNSFSEIGMGVSRLRKFDGKSFRSFDLNEK